MKKKGFTLVELLAVIAILAILVIIALPNIMSLFNEAKKNSFANELKELHKTAQNQWMSDSLIETADKYYAREAVTGCTSTQLQLSGRTQLKYGIKVNKAGNVVNFVATDGTYVYQYNSTEPLLIENVGSVTTANETNPEKTPNMVIRLTDYSKTKATITCSSGVYGLNIE